MFIEKWSNMICTQKGCQSPSLICKFMQGPLLNGQFQQDSSVNAVSYQHITMYLKRTNIFSFIPEAAGLSCLPFPICL